MAPGSRCAGNKQRQGRDVQGTVESLGQQGDLVYLKSAEGERIIEQYGMNNELGIRKQLANFWR